MPTAITDIISKPWFNEAAFLFGVLLLLGAWKFGVEGLLE